MLGTLSNNSSGKDEAIATAALADSTAKGFFKVAGVQWGVLDDVNSGSFSAAAFPSGPPSTSAATIHSAKAAAVLRGLRAAPLTTARKRPMIRRMAWKAGTTYETQSPRAR